MILYGSHVVMNANRMALRVLAAFFSLAFFSFLRLLISFFAFEAKRLASTASLVALATDWSTEDELTTPSEPF